MPADVTKEEFRALELEVEGEKLVTRHILEQSRRNGDDLAAIKTRLDRVEARLDGVDLKGLQQKVDGLDRKVDRLDDKVDGLAKALPRIVGDEMRKALRERDDKR
jgi:hypothetical protein